MEKSLLFWDVTLRTLRNIPEEAEDLDTPRRKPEIRQTETVLTAVKVKCTLVQALRLCTGRTAHRGSRGIALHFLDHGTGRG